MANSKYEIELETRSDRDSIVSLRLLLKALGRKHGFKCTRAVEVKQNDNATEGASND